MATRAAHAAPYEKPRGILPYALSAEWTKLWTLRSTYWTLLAAVVIVVGAAALYCAQVAAQWNDLDPQFRASFSAVSMSLNGIFPGQLAIAALGVLVVSGEYGTGMIRSTLTATPQRLRALGAKALVFAVVAFTVGELAAFLAFFTGQAFFATQGLATSLGEEGVLRAVIGGGLYLTAGGVFGLAFGALVRNTAGAITATIATLFFPALLATLLPADTGATLLQYVTSNAGTQIMQPHDLPNVLAPWVGYGVFWAWVAAIALVAAVLLVRRDA